MRAAETTRAYSSVARQLHWLIAALIVIQFVLANLAESAGEADAQLRQLALLANHKSVGLTVLGLAVVRLIWRLMVPPPLPLAQVPPWQNRLAAIAHWAMYALLFLLPISGWLMSSASAYSVSWFDLVQLPDFVSPDPQVKSLLVDVHEALAIALAVIAGLHVAAAVKHHFIDGDGVLQRMASPVPIALSTGLLVAGSWWLGFGVVSKRQPTTEPAVQAAPIEAVSIDRSNLPAWNIDYAQSYIEFSATQAGAQFSGTWDNWVADMRFSADEPGQSNFDVTVRTAHVSTGDAERDSALLGVEWFDVLNYPDAHYRADSFELSPDGNWIAQGQLIIKGFAASVPLNFRVEQRGDGQILEGSASLQRLVFNVGTGDWSDTSWVGNDVAVNVRVVAVLP